MKLNCLRDYIKLFIKEKYITNDNDSEWFRLYLDSKNGYKNIQVIFSNKNKLELKMKDLKNIITDVSNLLDLPVLKVGMIAYNSADNDFLYGKSKSIDITETEDILTGKIKYTIRPRITNLKNELGTSAKWLLIFTCMNLPIEYMSSFLFKKNILEPVIYNTLVDFGNTVLSRSKYDHAIDYIKKHKSSFNYNTTDNHLILESEFSKILSELYRIRYVNDDVSISYYIIEKKDKHDKNRF